jgi:hypothetical protein
MAQNNKKRFDTPQPHGKFAMTDRRSGCSCNIDDEDHITKLCNLHRELIVNARKDALEEAATAASEACWRYENDSRADGVTMHQTKVCVAAIRALKV